MQNIFVNVDSSDSIFSVGIEYSIEDSLIPVEVRHGDNVVSPCDQVCKGLRGSFFIILYDLAGHGRFMLRMVP